GYRVVGHDVPVAGRAADAQARHAASASPCYAELIVTRIAYRRPAFGAVRSLRVSFLFRDFGDAAAPRWSHDGGGAGELGVWPPQHVNEAELAAAELEAVFRENVGTFARGLREARQRGR
ncbi:MAG: hypothetical protein ACXWU1_13250, partial [Allosphingosinicella sp.]